MSHFGSCDFSLSAVSETELANIIAATNITITGSATLITTPTAVLPATGTFSVTTATVPQILVLLPPLLFFLSDHNLHCQTTY